MSFRIRPLSRWLRGLSKREEARTAAWVVRSRRRKGKTVDLRRDFRLKESRQRFLYPFRYHPSLGMGHWRCQRGWATDPR
jgi:hypothetical protein